MKKSEPKSLLRFKLDEQEYTIPLVDEPGFGLTPREAGRVKVLASGTAGVGILNAVGSLDTEVIAALAIVAAERAGVKVNVDAVFDGKCVLEFELVDLEAEAAKVVPLAPPAAAAEAGPDTSQDSSTTLAGTGVPS